MPKRSIKPSLIIAAARRPALFRRLEDNDRRTSEIAGPGKVARRTQQDRGVTVMTTGMHPFVFGGMGRLVSSSIERIYVGSQTDHLDVTAGRPHLALNYADHACPTEAGHDLVAAEYPQALGDDARSAMFVKAKLGMRVDVAPLRPDITVEVGDAIENGHVSLFLE